MTKVDNEALAGMLQMRRPHNSKTEKQFIRDFIWPLGMTRDGRGNLIKRIGDAPVLWSSHTDSVHRFDGYQGIKIEDGVLRLANGSKSNCLGADDAVGVWLMREMIRAERPGLYVFHRQEESGGIGSLHIARTNKALLDGIKYAIAFDRRGTQDVITYQRWQRCCSEEFAGELATRLNTAQPNLKLAYRPSDDGLFTDTASYMDIIPECTNLSVGYRNEHSSSECVSLEHVFKLRKALLKLDVTGLPATRDPSKKEYRGGNYYGRGYGGGHSAWGDYYGENWDYEYGHWRYRPHKSKKNLGREIDDDNRTERRVGTIVAGHSPRGRTTSNQGPHPWTPNIEATIKQNPDVVLKILKAYGMSETEVAEEIYANGGALIYK